jgi:hypothetical protein
LLSAGTVVFRIEFTESERKKRTMELFGFLGAKCY